MRFYIVKVVEAERLPLWHERWPLKGSPTRRALEEDHNGSLSQTIEVKARNKLEANQKAREAKPGFAIIDDATQGPF